MYEIDKVDNYTKKMKESFINLIEKEIKEIEEFSRENYDKDKQYEDVMNWELQGDDNPIFDAGSICGLKNLLLKLKI